MDRARRGKQRRHNLVWNARIERHVLAIRPVIDGLHAKRISHSRHIGRDRAVAQRDQNLRALAHDLDLVQILFTADRAFDQRNVDVLGKLLGIDQRAVDQIGSGGDVEQALVHVEE